MCRLGLPGYQLTLAHGQDSFTNNAQEVGAPRDAAIDDSIAKNIAVVVESIAVDHTDLLRA